MIKRLTKNDIKDLINLNIEAGNDFPYNLVGSNNLYDITTYYSTGELPDKPMTQIYGYFTDISYYDKTVKLIGVMTATFSFVFPHKDNPNGRIVHISGAYVLRDYRHKYIATELLKYIERNAIEYFKADYLCCDSSADDLYYNNGFKQSNESRLWKPLPHHY